MIKGIDMLNTASIPARSGVLAQLAKGGYQAPSVISFPVEALGKSGPLSLAGNSTVPVGP
jgi:hypothetical protein